MKSQAKISPMTLRIIGYFGLLSVIALFFYLNEPRFTSKDNITAILRHLAATGLAGLGLTFVIVVRKFDLSFPGVISFGAMCVGYFIAMNVDLRFAILAAMGACAVFGLINGLAVSYLRMPDIVTTVAVGSIAGGGAFLFSGGTNIFRGFFTSGILDLNDGKIWGVSYSTIFLLSVYGIAFALLNLSRWGRSFYATGENAIAAMYSGINVRAYVLVAFVICAVMMVFAATLVIAQGGRSEPIAGNGFLMSAYASVLLGAALFERPGVIPTFAGTLLISMILNGFTLISVPYYWSNAVVSTVLILGVIVFDSRTGGAIRRALSGPGKPQNGKAATSISSSTRAGEPAA